jgi:glycosyltransferase involved in cell wall biosynthesis
MRHRRYDDIYATGEDVGLPTAILLWALLLRDKLTMVVHCADTPKRRAVLRALGDRVFRHVITLSATQERLLTGPIGFGRKKVVRLNYWIDHAFYSPAPDVGGEYALSVGMESRDYATLQEAVSELPQHFHVVASGWSPLANYSDAAGVREEQNVRVERGVTTARLRELYSGARMVVVPLKPVSYAAGVTAIIEAMAMGKAVVTTDSPGIRDYVIPDVSAKVVPCGDAPALRAAISGLWNDREATEAMARFNRAWIESMLNTDRYVEEVARLLEAPGPGVRGTECRPGAPTEEAGAG